MKHYNDQSFMLQVLYTETVNRVIMKGHFNKPICAIITSLVLILGTFAVVLPYQEAEAEHMKVKVQIWLNKNGQLHTTLGLFSIPCTPDCGIDIDLSNRDKKRFDRWCDSNPLPIMVPADTLFKNITCEGKGPWDIKMRVTLTADNPSEGKTHPTPITVNVGAI